MFTDNREKQLTVLGALLHACGVAVTVAGIVVLERTVLAPLEERSDASTRRAVVMSRLLRNAGAIQRDREDLMAELAETERRAESVRDRIPDEPKESEFLGQITTAAKAEGFTIQGYKRADLKAADRHSQLNVHLSCEGNFESICGFLDRLARLPRVSTIDQMQIHADDQKVIYAVDLTLRLYFGNRAADSSIQDEARG